MKKIALSISALILTSPSYATVYCEGTLKNQSVIESIKVKKNCTLENLIIHGDVIVGHNAIAVLNNNHIKGNIIANTTFRALSATDNIVQGYVLVNQGKDISLRANIINGNLSLQKNTGIIKIYDNQIAGSLICTNNTFTINGGKNTVSGNKQQQCQTF